MNINVHGWQSTIYSSDMNMNGDQSSFIFPTEQIKLHKIISIVVDEISSLIPSLKINKK